MGRFLSFCVIWEFCDNALSFCCCNPLHPLEPQKMNKEEKNKKIEKRRKISKEKKSKLWRIFFSLNCVRNIQQNAKIRDLPIYLFYFFLSYYPLSLPLYGGGPYCYYSLFYLILLPWLLFHCNYSTAGLSLLSWWHNRLQVSECRFA